MSLTNCVCKLCNSRLNNDRKHVVVCTECSCISHENCYRKQTAQNTCPKCKIVNRYRRESDLSKDSQDYINVLSTKRTTFSPKIKDHLRLIKRFIPALHYFCRLDRDCWRTTINPNEMNVFLDGIQWCLNIYVTVEGQENIDNNIKKIFVANHISDHDALIIPRFVMADGVLASVAVVKNPIGYRLQRYRKNIIIERGKKQDAVKIMEDYMKENNSLFVFPTGIFDNFKTISKFRKGAFQVAYSSKYAIQPISVSSEQDISSMNQYDIFRLKRVDYKIKILPVVYGKDYGSVEDFAEDVRKMIANAGGLLLSNVYPSDVKD